MFVDGIQNKGRHGTDPWPTSKCLDIFPTPQWLQTIATMQLSPLKGWRYEQGPPINEVHGKKLHFLHTLYYTLCTVQQKGVQFTGSVHFIHHVYPVNHINTLCCAVRTVHCTASTMWRLGKQRQNIATSTMEPWDLQPQLSNPVIAAHCTLHTRYRQKCTFVIFCVPLAVFV